MQSFRERSGFHGNQPCYQQEPHELSRLESYRQHPHHPHPQHPHPGPGGPGQTRPGYEPHALATATGMPPGGPVAGPGGAAKDCYSQPTYPGYPGSGGGNGAGNGGVAPSQAKKPYRGSKGPPPPSPSQHLQGPGGYSNHMGPGAYPSQYLNEGHLQQKWEEPAQMGQYEQEMVGRLEPAGPAPPAQYMDQNLLGHSQTQHHHPGQPSTPVYSSPHHQPHPAPSPLMYPQSHLHYPQHSPSPSPSASYMDKCSTMAHCYKGYSMPPSSQYGRQMSGHSSLKQGGYRPPQNTYGYQQPPSRVGYEPQPPLQGMPTPQEAPHPKYQHYPQSQQNYCLSDLSVRSPEQYYQTCSPSSSHSPARSLGRSPSYSSTPSPLMTNPESFQYSQPPMTPGPTSSSSASSVGMQEQGSATMLMPPRSHPSPSVPHPAPHSYTSGQGPSMKERFSEKLLSNPSLWSLNALTSQVENISNNVQQLLLSEALVANKKAGKRSSGGSTGSGGSSKKDQEYKDYKSPPGPDGSVGSGVGGPMQDPYGTPQHQPLPMEIQEGGYSSSSDEQLDRGYYYCGQGRSPAQAPSNSHNLSLDTASSCSMTSPDDMSTRSGDSGLHNLTPDPRSQGMMTPAKSVGDERSPASVTVPSPMKQERDSPPDIQRLGEPPKENFEESAWMEKMAEEEEVAAKKTPDRDCRGGEVTGSPEKLEKWPEDEKGPALYSKISKVAVETSYRYDDTVYQGIQSKYEPDERDLVVKSPAHSDSSPKIDLGHEMKSEAFKSESPTDSESSRKTSPYLSRGDLEQDQYLTEKEDSSESASPNPRGEASDESNSEKRESREEEVDVREGEVSESPPSIHGDGNNRREPGGAGGELCGTTDDRITEPLTSSDPAQTTTHPDTAVLTAEETSMRVSEVGDVTYQHQSSLPLFSAHGEQVRPPAQSRDHMDHGDAKVLEPDSPQLPGKSMMHSAPSWANTPPSPEKGDEDMEPGISCPSAVTPSAKPEPVVPSAQPRAFGRKHVRGRRRAPNPGVGIRRQLSLEKASGKEGDGAPSPPQKPCMPSSKTVLFSDQMDFADQEAILSETPKLLAEGLRSRMCTRSSNAPEVPPKIVDPNVKQKPGPKPGSKPGPKQGSKPGPKPGLKPGPKPGAKPGLKPGPKPGPKSGLKPGPKPVPKYAPKPGLKPGPKPGPKSAPKLEDILPLTDSSPPLKPQVGRPKGSKTKLVHKDDPIQPIISGTGHAEKSLATTVQPVDKYEEVKVPGKDGKNMVLRSRKPPQGKLPKDKAKDQEEGLTPQTLTEIKADTVSLKGDEDPSTLHHLTAAPIETDTPITQFDQRVEKMIIPLKRKLSAESPLASGKKKRGPKPKPKPAPPEPRLTDEVLPKESGARGSKRKRGKPPKACFSIPPPTKETTSVDLSDTSGDVPTVAPLCLAKTKYLPPRKGRGQKYEAMVQKNTAPSAKKHPPTPQTESSTLAEELTPRASSEQAPKDGETGGPEATEVEVRPAEARQAGVRPEAEVATKDVARSETEGDKLRPEAVAAEVSKPERTRQEEEEQEERQGEVRWEVLNPEEVRQEAEEAHRPATGAAVPSSAGVQLEEGGLPHPNPVAVLPGPAATAKPPRTKRKRWAMVESTDATAVAMEAGSLIVTTPRLAKQRAIKNNHEMHLKQKRKKKKGDDPAQGPEETEGENVEPSPAPPPPPPPPPHRQEADTKTDPAETPSLSLASSPGEIIESPPVAATEPVQKPRRGRKPSANPTKRRRGKGPSEPAAGKPVKVYKKPGPKPGMKDAMEIIEAVVRAAESEQREKEERMQREGLLVPEDSLQPEAPAVEQVPSKARKTPRKRSFRPYVHVDSSGKSASQCVVINRPEQVLVPLKSRKRNLATLKVPVPVDTATMQAPAMQQGPLVNRSLADRRLTCCLCRNPANYRELGDLCGPYYPEDSIPRKTVSARHLENPREIPARETHSSVSEDPAAPAPKDEEEGGVEKQDGEESHLEPSVPQEGASGEPPPHHCRHRRPERPARAGGKPRRLTLRERFRRMQQLQAQGDSSRRPPGGGEGGCSLLRRLQGEAEAKEHWAHENCAVWTSGVVLVAGRLFGLKEAAGSSAETSCSKCQGVGASIGCSWGDCSKKYHYFCAKEIGCTFEENDFSLQCPKHEVL
ncbi:retinoic acid-induced protein 1 [Aplochiton taeniatus]